MIILSSGPGFMVQFLLMSWGKGEKTIVVIEQRDHIAGNIYARDVDGIHVHEYGAHIFHTSDKGVWDYVNQFAEFNHYINSPVARI